MTWPTRIVLRHVMHITQRQGRGVFCATENGSGISDSSLVQTARSVPILIFTSYRMYGSCGTYFISNFDLVLSAIKLAFGLKVLDALLQLSNFRL